MSTLQDLAGTISNQFAIGNSEVKIITGSTLPENNIGNIGDLYITNYQQTEPDEIFETYAEMTSYTGSKDGEIYEVTADETKNDKTTYYECKADGASFIYEYMFDKCPCGKVYIKDTTTDKNGSWKEVGTGTGGATTIKYW